MNSALIAKDVRALLPIFAACLVTLAGGYLQPQGVLMELSVAVFVAAPALIGAHAFGHEYSHRTLPALLAQPVDQRRVFLQKWAVAAMMSLILVAISSMVLSHHAEGMWQRWNVSILPLLGGLLVAPWLALVLRNTLASALATGTLFGMALMVPAILIAVATGSTIDDTQTRLVVPWSAAMGAFSIVAILLAFQKFAHLEAGDTAARSLTLPRFGSARSRQFRPLVALASKELQLQQLTVALAFLFIVMSVALVILQRTIVSWLSAPIGAIMALYCILLSLVIGAMASAEERQLGVAEWQLIQPVAAGTQWIVKVAVSMGLAIVLAAVLPSLLVKLAVNPDESARLLQLLLLPTIFLTAAGLYLSSLTTSGTWALVLTLPAGVAASIFLRFLDHRPLAITGPSLSPLGPLSAIAWALLPVLLVLGFMNHRASRRTAVATASQIIVIAVVIAATHFVALNR